MSIEAYGFLNPLMAFVNPATGAPYASGSVAFNITGTNTPLNVYSDVALSVSLPNPVPLNASGYTSTSTSGVPTPVYLQQQAYDVTLLDVNNATVWGPVTVSGSAWPGQIQGQAVLSPAVNANGFANRFTTTINKASSGTHALFTGTRFDVPTIGAGASTLTEASTVYIAGAPATGTNQYALHVAGGTAKFDGSIAFSGALVLGPFSEMIQTVSFTGTPTFDLSVNNNFTITLTGNITAITVSNWVAAECTTATIRFLQDGGGGHTIAFPAGWKWAGGSAPTTTTSASKATVVVLYSPDGGTTIYASLFTDNA